MAKFEQVLVSPHAYQTEFIVCVYVCVYVFELTTGTGLLLSPWWCRSIFQLTPGIHLHGHCIYRLEGAKEHRWKRDKKKNKHQ